MVKRKAPAMADSPMMDEGWRARSDLRTLTEASEISRDRARLRAAHAEAKRQMQGLNRVTGMGRGGGRGNKTTRRKRLENVEL